MLRHDESSIRRHPDGSLDISFYGSRALWLRKAARTDALKRIATIVKANLTPIGSRMGARNRDATSGEIKPIAPSPRPMDW